MIFSYRMYASEHHHRTTIRSCTKCNAFKIRNSFSLVFTYTFCRKVTSIFFWSIAIFRDNLRVHHILTQLNPNRYYAVYVMLRLNNISLPYDKLLINTKSKCTFGLNAYETHRDNHGSIIPNDILM